MDWFLYDRNSVIKDLNAKVLICKHSRIYEPEITGKNSDKLISQVLSAP